MANVSTTTVSHVVNKTRYVSPELVERVEKAIRKPVMFRILLPRKLLFPPTVLKRNTLSSW